MKTVDFYMEVEGVEFFSSRDIKVKGTLRNTSGEIVSTCNTLYLPREGFPRFGLGEKIRVTVGCYTDSVDCANVTQPASS